MKLYIVLALLLSLLVVSAHSACVDLATAANFGLLGGSGVTNAVPGTVVIGDVGSSPTPAVTGFPPGVVVGTLYTTPNAVTAQAQSDLTAAYITAAGLPCPATNDLTGIDLGTFNAANPLLPGVYCFSSSAGLTGNLTLDAQGDPNACWVFQIGSSLITATGASVTLINGADPCNVFWQVGSSATIQTGNTFVGNIMALTSITLNGGTLQGRALARNGAVTISGSEMVDTTCAPASPLVSITKKADREEAGVGDTITYTYVVLNGGTTNLTVNSVIDSKLGDLTAAFMAANGGSDMLAPGASVTFTQTHLVTAGDQPTLTNTVTVTAEDSAGTVATGTAQETVVITPTTPTVCVHITKIGDRIVAAVGQTIQYTFTVTNCGTAPLTVSSVSDSLLGDLTADFVAANGMSSTLAAGASVTFTEDYTVLATDPSSLVNTVTVTANSGPRTVVTSTDTWTVTVVPGPSITIVKTGDRTSAKDGDTIKYSFTVCNTGGLALTVTSVSDTILGQLLADFIAANGGSSILQPGVCVIFTKNYKVKCTDTSPLINTVVVRANSGTTVVTGTSQWTVIIPPVVRICVTKTADRTCAMVGDVIRYTFKVCNGGTVPLTVTSVNDSLLGEGLSNFIAANGGSAILQPGVCVTFTGCYKVKCSDKSPLENKVTVTANNDGTVATAKDEVSVCIKSVRMNVTKTADRTKAAVGDVIKYTVSVRNCGSVPLTVTSVCDSLLGEGLCNLKAANRGSATLQPNACVTFTGCYKVKCTDRSPLVNKVTVTAHNDGAVICETAQVPVTITSCRSTR